MQDIIEKAKKLLALRDRAGTRAEAEAAARALARILDKHRITMAEIATQKGDDETIVADAKLPLIEWRRAVAWRRSLINALCAHYGVACWRAKRYIGHARDGRRRYVYAMHLCGRPSDVALVRYLFAWLSTELARISEVECAGRGNSFKNSWMLGFAEGINQQLNAAREEIAKEMGDGALALLNRQQEAMMALEQQIKGLTTIKYSMRIHGDAHEAGKKHGKSHHLGDKLDTGNARALPEAV